MQLLIVIEALSAALATLKCSIQRFSCMQDTIVAIRKGGDKLVVGNVVADKYPTIEFSTDPNQVRAQKSCGPSAQSDLQVCHLHSSFCRRSSTQPFREHTTCLPEGQLGLQAVVLLVLGCASAQFMTSSVQLPVQQGHQCCIMCLSGVKW
jgi:hypothetical protein